MSYEGYRGSGDGLMRTVGEFRVLEEWGILGDGEGSYGRCRAKEGVEVC